ncbi:28773_t:CDS:2 [Gigaspora margarita]|uniref:28773_t:CDS:1 n=1 Tax=Gigaspora margarita TaxID=4874 RepID=A0ABN7UCR9_GIGMA|nr:28773_t:CDS:2 [Gigaspora margarita]
MNEPNSIDIELKVSNNQNIEPEMSNNQDTEFEVPENENIEYEISDNHDTKLEILVAYDSIDDLSNIDKVEESANCILSQLPNKISKAISKKRKFGELWGLVRKVITDAIEDNNEHIYHELLRFFTSIQKKTSQKIINNISVDGFNNSTNNNSFMLDIQNSIKRKSKGYPKSKRIANAFEKSNTVTNYKCKICKQSGHNSQTCKKKQRILMQIMQMKNSGAIVNLDYKNNDSNELLTIFVLDTEESGPSNVMVLILPPIQSIDPQNYKNK